MNPYDTPTLVVLDLDDTLYPYAPSHKLASEALAKLACQETGVPLKQWHAVFAEARAAVKKRLGQTGASHSRLLYVQEALAQVGFPSQPALALTLDQEYWRTYVLSMRASVGAEDLLSTLRYNSVPIAIVTDLTAQIQFRKLVHLQIDTMIDYVVTSEECAGDKPTLAPFRLLFDRINDERLATNVWFVGDADHDAPVDELRDLKLIGNGHGWVKNGAISPTITSWSSLADVESEFSRYF